MSPSVGGFLQNMQSLGALVEVTVEHNDAESGPTSQQVECLVQASKGFFEVDAPVFEGDWVTLPDPRGGTERRYVSKVKINNVPAIPHMSHIAVDWGQPPRDATVAQQGPTVINISGHARVVWNNSGRVDQSQSAPVATGFEDLARAVDEALGVLRRLELAPDNLELGEESAREVLEEVIKPEPDRSRVRRALAGLRLVLTSAASGAAGGTVEELVQQLVLSS